MILVPRLRSAAASECPAARNPGWPTKRIVALAEALRHRQHPDWAGAEPGIRELVIGGTPYVVLHRVRRQRVTINTLWHAAQRKEE